jgi:hypothetical protein
MARNVFYSFHYVPDNWRASQVRNAGVLEGNQPCSDNDWESITKAGEKEIQKWIDGQLSGRSCAVVLIGANTAGRKWINYEIEKAWNDKKGLLGIHIHNLLDANQKQTTKGSNPFATFTLNEGKTKLSSVVKTYDPPYTTSKNVYDHIKSNLESWVEEAIEIRNNYKPN